MYEKNSEASKLDDLVNTLHEMNQVPEGKKGRRPEVYFYCRDCRIFSSYRKLEKAGHTETSITKLSQILGKNLKNIQYNPSLFELTCL